MRRTSTRTASQQLAEYVCRLDFADIPRAAIDQAKDHLVHHLGLAFSGYFREEARQAVRIAHRLSGSAGDTTIIGERAKARALDSAFANCTMMRALGLDDVLFPAGVHAGLVTLPVALAIGEQEKRSGREVLTAIVLGYDLIGKLGNLVWAWSAPAPRRPTIPFGPFGSVAVAARLLGLTPEQASHAIGYAAHSAMGLAEGALTTHYYSLVARNGILGALLAQAGGQTAPTVLEGRFGFFRTFFGDVPADLQVAIDSLGHEFEIMNAVTKRYPGTALNIVPIQLLLEMVGAYGLTADNVAEIKVYLPRERENFAEGHAGGPFTSRTIATSSLPFALAVILLDGALNPQRYEQFDDPRILAITRKVQVCLESGRTIRYARLEITTNDRRRYWREADSYRFPRQEWSDWLRQDGRRLLPEAKLTRLARLVAELEAVEDVSALTACLTPDAEDDGVAG